MRIKVLGSAAGGGFPQWNCACRNCTRLRDGSLQGVARTQTQIAIDCNPDYALRRYWVFVNASPDLRAQMLGTRELHPFLNTNGSTPLSDIFLPSADVDSIMGLLHLREFQGFRIFSLPSIRRIVSEENSIFRVLGRATPPVQWFPLSLAKPADWQTQYDQKEVPKLIPHAVSLRGDYPDYISEKLRAELPSQEAVVGFAFHYGAKRLFFAPTIPGHDQSWISWAQSSDLVLIDGTFWSDDELIRTGRSKKTARQIGHLPLSGPGGLLSQYPAKATGRKVLIHINNTNPILDENSAEHRAVLEAGFEIAYDGMELKI
jgi:pyrroloquinoline quinone biosynthesis protein B